MSTFCLKVIALLAMTVDHLGLVFGAEGWNWIPFDSSVLRAIGRISFPLFAFCLAQGWHRTHSRKKYFNNVMWGAVISQIPFSMAFYGPNLARTMTDDASVFYFSTLYLLFAAAAIGCYWVLALQKRWSVNILAVVAAALLPGFHIRVHGVWILCGNLNVFYTFLMAFFCLYILEQRGRMSFRQRIAYGIVGVILLAAYGLPADYGTGLLGIVLIMGFVLLPGKGQQAVFLLLWSCLFYGLWAGSMLYTVSCAIAGVVILLYDPQANKGPRVKKLFYWYYPAHLLLLGLLNLEQHFR